MMSCTVPIIVTGFPRSSTVTLSSRRSQCTPPSGHTTRKSDVTG
nr:hypothetical protein [Amycolatopsis tolypomycina]